jgi:hypothetical protein
MKRPAGAGGAILGEPSSVALARNTPQPGLLCPCGAPARRLGCRLCLPLCVECRARSACVICADWSWIKPRPLLPVRPDWRRKPWQFQLRRGRLEAHALVLRSRRRGWTDDPNLPFIITDISLDFAEWLLWAGQT